MLCPLSAKGLTPVQCPSASLQGLLGPVRGRIAVAPIPSWAPPGKVTGQQPGTLVCSPAHVRLGGGDPERVGPSHPLYLKPVAALVVASSIPGSSISVSHQNPPGAKEPSDQRGDLITPPNPERDTDPMAPVKARAGRELSWLATFMAAQDKPRLPPVFPIPKSSSISPATCEGLV